MISLILPGPSDCYDFQYCGLWCYAGYELKTLCNFIAAVMKFGFTGVEYWSNVIGEAIFFMKIGEAIDFAKNL